MTKTSKKTGSLEESPTLAITAKANAMRAEGKDVLSFGAGEPDFDTPDNIKAAAKKAIDEGKTRYTPVGGIRELKDAIVEKFRRDNGLEYTPGEVIVSCGGKHCIYNLMQAILDPGDEVIIPAPYWVSYPPMVTLAGGAAKIVRTTVESGYKVTAKAMNEATGAKTKAVVINSPSNPTGAVYTKEELGELAEVLIKKDILIISDEIYDRLTYDGVPAPSIASLSNEVKERCFVLNGVSKTYAMTGWRIGYGAGDADIVKAMTKIQSQSTSNPASISQWAAVEALTGPQDSVAKMVDVFKGRRDVMVKGLNAIDGIKCATPGGAFYVFPAVSGLYGKSHKGGQGDGQGSGQGDGAIKGSIDLASYLLSAAGVAVVPGAAFGDDDHLRISYACSDEDIKRGLKKIGDAVGELK